MRRLVVAAAVIMIAGACRIELGDDGSGGGGAAEGGTGYILTCHDGRSGAEQCVHYTFASSSDLDDFYYACAGLTSRTRGEHNCPSGATGGGYCRHSASGRATDTYTYNGSGSEIRSRCASTSGTWFEF